jgi:O-antigen ligase
MTEHRSAPFVAAQETTGESWIGKTCGWAVMLVLAGVPLLIAPGVSLYFDVTPKIVLLLCGASLAAMLPGAYLPGVRKLIADRSGRIFLLLLAAQSLSLAVSTTISDQPALSLTGSTWRRLGLLSHAGLLLFTLVTAGWLAGHRQRLMYLLRGVALTGAAVALYSSLQYFGIDPLLPKGAYHVGEADWAIVRPPGTLGHAGYLATFLVTAAFLSAGLWRRDASGAWRTIGLVAGVTGSVAVVLSGTRGAVVGLVAAGLWLWLWFRPRCNRRAIVIGALIAASVAGFYYSPGGRRLRNRVEWSSEDALGGARLWLWKDSLRMGAWYGAAGAGPEMFSSAFPRFQSLELARAYPNRYNESPHNILLDALTAQGIAGLLVLLGLVALPLGTLRRAASERGVLAGFGGAAFVAALTSNQFLAFTLPTALYFYVTAALLVVLALESDSPTDRARWAGLVVPGMAVPLGFMLVFFALKLAMADRAMLQVREEAAAGDIREAIAGYEEVLRIKPKGMETDLWFSRLMAGTAGQTRDPATNLAAWLAGFEAARRATTASDAPQNAYYNLAAFHSMQNDFARTETALRKATEAAPMWYKPRWLLAQVLREAGRLEEALVEAQTAAALNGGENPEVEATLKELTSLSGKKTGD